MSDFEKALAYLLSNEGGYTNNALDPGGITNWGITRRAYEGHIGHDVTAEEMKNLTREEAAAFYQKQYWEPLKLGSLPTLVGTALLDMSVNEGYPTAVGFAQECVECTVDREIGPETLRRLAAIDPARFIHRFTARVACHYAEIVSKNPTRAVFINGWIKRAMKLLSLLETA